MQDIQGAFKDLNLTPKLTTSREWYKTSFATAGDWDAWVWSTVMHKPYGARDYHFSAFVLANEKIGKANASITLLALQNRRPVFHWTGGKIQRVSKLRQVSDSWTDGWEPVSAPGVAA